MRIATLQLIWQKKMELIETIAHAKKTGFEVIEFTTLPGDTFQEREDLAKQLKEEADKQDMEINTYAVSADFLYGGEAGSIKDEVDTLKEELKLAKILGAKAMRHDVAHGINYEKDPHANYFTVVGRMAEGIREVTNYAASLGIKTMTENHGFSHKIVNAWKPWCKRLTIQTLGCSWIWGTSFARMKTRVKPLIVSCLMLSMFMPRISFLNQDQRCLQEMVGSPQEG